MHGFVGLSVGRSVLKKLKKIEKRCFVIIMMLTMDSGGMVAV